MAISLPNDEGILDFKKRMRTIRTDIFKFENLNIITEAGVPSGQWDKGTLFANASDYKLYLAVNYKEDYLPNVAWYKFNGNGSDEINSYTATTTNITFPAGKYGNAAYLNGSDGKITLPGNQINIQPLADATQPTISFWIKFSGIETPGDQVYVLERYTDANNYLLISIENEAGVYGVRFKWNTPTGGVDVTDTTIPLEADTWTHIIFVGYDAGTSCSHQLYIDQADNSGFSSAQDPGPSFVGDENWTIGYSEVETSYGDGTFLIDDLKISTTNKGNDTTDRYFEYSSLDQNDWRVFSGSLAKAI